MSIYNDVTNLIHVAPTVEGYPATGQSLPYVVTRPLLVSELEAAIAGNAIDFDHQFVIYCAAASVEASYNLAIAVMVELQGARVGGTTLRTSMGYSGAPVEGHYETAVTVQLNQGGIQ